jgi:hypothetical protein
MSEQDTEFVECDESRKEICDLCCHRPIRSDGCFKAKCTSFEREDRKRGYFVRKPTPVTEPEPCGGPQEACGVAGCTECGTPVIYTANNRIETHTEASIIIQAACDMARKVIKRCRYRYANSCGDCHAFQCRACELRQWLATHQQTDAWEIKEM